MSDQTVDTSCQDDASSNGAKDDEDDEEDDDDKMEGLTCGDPEKLKAFNMFVRLFVDENLDRHVPISKQPKEKIQVIAFVFDPLGEKAKTLTLSSVDARR